MELELVAEALTQLARMAQELLRPEEERDPAWRSIPVAKDITVAKGIARRAPWENIIVGNFLRSTKSHKLEFFITGRR